MNNRLGLESSGWFGMWEGHNYELGLQVEKYMVPNHTFGTKKQKIKKFYGILSRWQ